MNDNSQEKNKHNEIPESPAKVFSIIFYLTSIIFLIFALVVTYKDSSYSSKIVGGDAYNYMIFAGRGTVLMGGAIVSCLFGLACQLANFTHIYKNRLSK